jgi:hypothetical protein
MHVPLLLQMVHEAIPDRVVIGSRDGGMTVAGLVTAPCPMRSARRVGCSMQAEASPTQQICSMSW